MLVGSEGALGVILSATLRVRRRPEKTVFRSWMFPEFGPAVEAVRLMVQAGLRPGVVRLLDAEETDSALALLGGGPKALRSALIGAGLGALSALGRESGRRALLIASFEGEAGLAHREAQLAGALARSGGGFPLGATPGALWIRRRFENPYLRDALLDHGLFLDTLETATGWDALHDLHRDVRRAVQETMARHGTPGYVMAHLSHVYPSGASLYFILVTCQLPGREEEQWTELKRAATDVIVRSGAAVSHHHGIGLDHRPWFECAPGREARVLLRRLKQELDPTGVMNPGKLVPAPNPGSNRPPGQAPS
jgi:alkyldihydroxyacetonephosphate synthase